MKAIQTLGLIVLATAIILALAESRRIAAPSGLLAAKPIATAPPNGHCTGSSPQTSDPGSGLRRSTRDHIAADPAITSKPAEPTATSDDFASQSLTSPVSSVSSTNGIATPHQLSPRQRSLRELSLHAASPDHPGSSSGIVSNALQEATPLPQPAAWADPGDMIPANSDRDLAIQQEAERLIAEITAFPTDNPDSYRSNWQDAVSRSDQQLRQRYGGWVWMAHHIQAHHLANGHHAIPDTSR